MGGPGEHPPRCCPHLAHQFGDEVVPCTVSMSATVCRLMASGTAIGNAIRWHSVALPLLGGPLVEYQSTQVKLANLTERISHNISTQWHGMGPPVLQRHGGAIPS